MQVPVRNVFACKQTFSSNQAGFGMIEVLVALLVLSIGLLGMASLQTTGLKMTSGAQNHTQAILLAQDLVERGRVNRSRLSDYAVPAGNAPACNVDFEIENTDVAEDDKDEWRNSLACLLPAGNGEVAVNGDAMVITITWAARDNAGDIDDGELELEVTL